MIDSEALARELLGPDAEAFDYALRSGSHAGLRLNFPEMTDARKFVAKRWRKAYEGGVELFVGAAQFQTGPGEYSDSWGAVEFDPADGPPQMPDPNEAPPSVVPVFALHGIETLDVIEFADVGSHNAIFPDAGLSAEMLAGLPEEVRAFMQNRPDFTKIIAEQRQKLGITGELPWEQTQSGLRQVMELAPLAITFADPAGLKARFVKKVSTEAANRIADIIMCLAPESYDCPPDEIAWLIEQDRRFRLWWD
jgi:hypothetical protein